MANNTNHNPLFFDTAAGSKTGLLIIKSITWTSDSGANLDIAENDDFLASDGAGNRIIGKRAESAGDDLHIDYGPDGKVVKDITITTLDGGVCYVELI